RPGFERHKRQRLEEAGHDERRAAGQRVPLVLLAQPAEVDDAARPRDSDLGVADEHERYIVRRVARTPAFVMRKELARPFAHADPTHVEEVRTGDAVPLTKARRVPLGRHVDADPDDLVRDTLVSKGAPNHSAPLP